MSEITSPFKDLFTQRLLNVHCMLLINSNGHSLSDRQDDNKSYSVNCQRNSAGVLLVEPGDTKNMEKLLLP